MSTMPLMDLGVLAPRVDHRGSSSPGKNASRPTHEHEDTLSFSGILEEKQELQKPQAAGRDQGGSREASGETRSQAAESPASPGIGLIAGGSETGTTASLSGTAATQTGGIEYTSLASQNPAVPMTDLMLRIKTGEIPTQSQSETARTPESEAVKTQVTAQAMTSGISSLSGHSGPTGATLEIQPTAGEGKAVPAPVMEQAKATAIPTSTTQGSAEKAEVSLQSGSSSLAANSVKAGQTGTGPQAVMAGEVGENTSQTMEADLEQSTGAMVNGQVSLKDMKVTEGESKTAVSTEENQGNPTDLNTVNRSIQMEGTTTGTEGDADSAQNSADQLRQNTAQVTEQYSTQAAQPEQTKVAAAPAEQDITAAPLTTSSPVHPLDEGGLKVTPERATSTNQAQDIRQQVVRQLSTSLDGKIGQEKVVLQLNPEKLGQVEIQFVAKGNDLNIVISAQSGEAEKAIREGIRDLASGISDKSTRWQQVDIKVENRGQDPEKNDTRNEERRDQSRQEQNASHQQENQHRRPDGRPDWASLRGEG